MPDQPYCLKHNTRLMESGVDRFLFDSVFLQWVIQYNPSWLANQKECYLCKIIEEQLQRHIKEAAELEASVVAGGGTHTTDKIAVFRGGTDSEP